MKNYDYSNHVQKEAILNECKGNLFEFLVAQKLSVKSGSEPAFLMSLPADFKIQLSNYEQLIRDSEPILLLKLPELAQSTTDFVWDFLSLERLNFYSWNVIGKIFSSNDNEIWNETDIVGTYHTSDDTEKRLIFSLKLTKAFSFTNTKSAGAKSFISKYFSSFGKKAFDFQIEFNKLVDESFIKMAHKLYELNDMPFNGKFDESWHHQFSELPGELPDYMKTVVYENYHTLAFHLHRILDNLMKIDKPMFLDCLRPLCGFGSLDLTQINCFHTDYSLKKVSVYNSESLFKIENNLLLLPIKNEGSSVEFQLNDFSLQIRIKPMNKFTSPSYKINCSIRCDK